MANVKFLIAEDEMGIARLLEVIVQRHGFEARVVPDGRTALACIHDDPPDVILLDLHMPIMDGYEVLEALQRDPRTAAIPVIVMSTQESLEDLSCDACALVSKPFDLPLLDAALLRAAASASQSANT